MHEPEGQPLILDRGWMRYLRGGWFVLWCALALLLGLVLGSGGRPG